MQSSRGFTLVELMVTIAVIAILAMIAAPSMSNLVAKQRLNTTAQDLAYIFGQARSQSAVLRKDVTVKFENSPNTMTNFYWISKYEDIELSSDAKEVIFSPIGIGSSRINNPNYNKAKEDAIGNPLDPNYDANYVTQPETIVVPQLQTFTLCSTKLEESRVITISRIGVIEKIHNETGACT